MSRPLRTSSSPESLKKPTKNEQRYGRGPTVDGRRGAYVEVVCPGILDDGIGLVFRRGRLSPARFRSGLFQT